MAAGLLSPLELTESLEQIVRDCQAPESPLLRRHSRQYRFRKLHRINSDSIHSTDSMLTRRLELKAMARFRVKR